jgi:beta-1,4-mannooligosaccharide/beta-1,4-mannosyl-N-acetylglucosamine phosphorylase
MDLVKIIGNPLKNIPWENKQDNLINAPVWRYSKNPVIDRNPIEGVTRIFNSAVIPYKGEFIALLRAEECNGRPFLRMGRSKDGINFDIQNVKFDIVYENGDTVPRLFCQYDPRIVEIEGIYYILWCGQQLDDPKYPNICVAKTTDFKKFIHVSNPVLPPQRNGVFFPRKIKGEYVFLSRPSDLGHTRFGDIFASFSKDMVYWGKHKSVLRSESNQAAWCGTKIGAGPAPIETSEGWLLFYHGVTAPCNGYVYSMGAAILDIDDPSKCLYNCEYHILTPEMPYETKGFVDNVIFPCATLCDSETGRIAIYYGAADTVTALAFTTVSEIVAYIKKHSKLVSAKEL